MTMTLKPENLDLDSDFSESEIDYLEGIDCFTDVNVLPETGSNISSKLALDVTINEYIDTSAEKEILECKKVILNRFQTYETYYESQFSAIEDIALNCFPESAAKFSAKHQNDFFVKFNKYLVTDQYEKSALELLQFYKLDPKGSCYQLLTSILFYLEKKKHLEKVLSQIQLQLPAPLQKFSTSQSLSGPARGKVR